jgi:membrane protease YdiL (CAAX protease family)
VVIREVLTGRATAGEFLLAFASSCLYAGIILSLTGRLFSSEQLVNPSWEPVSLKLFRRRSARQPVRIPAIDEALVLLSVVLLLLFYVSPTFIRHGLTVQVIVNELLLILAPTLLFGWLGGWEWKQTFSLRRSPSGIVIGAALLGIGLSPWAPFIQAWQNKLWPIDPQMAEQQIDLFKQGLQSHAVFKVILIGLLAGVCEETLFRGPIQNSLLRRMPAWFAIGFSALLFSAIHLDAHGFPIRALLGGLLGWIDWRSGSIFPAMLTHGLFDTTQLALEAWELHPGMTGQGITGLDKVSLVVGAVVVVVAWFLLRVHFAARAARESMHITSAVAGPESRSRMLKVEHQT